MKTEVSLRSTPRLISYAALFAVLTAPLACGGSDEPSGDGDGDGDTAGTGGSTLPGSGGAGSGGAGSGGSVTGTGGGGPGTGGAGSGGSGTGTTDICPTGSESSVLDLNGVTLTAVPNLVNQHAGWGNFEGPVWIGDSLYYSNIGGENHSSVIWKLVPGNAPTIAVADSGSNGLATDGTKLFAAMHTNSSISTRELPALATATLIVNSLDDKRFNSPNDLVVAGDGTVFFTDPTYQESAGDGRPRLDSELAYVVKGGVATGLNMLNAPTKPNGITLSLDETSLYIGGGNGLYKYTLNPDGSVQSPGQNLTSTDLTASDNVDGLGRDCAGNIYAAVHGKKLVVVLSPAGAQLGSLAVPSNGGVTNIAFGGADRQTIFVTSLGSPPEIHSAALNVPGYPY